MGLCSSPRLSQMSTANLIRRLTPSSARRAIRAALPISVHRRLRAIAHGTSQQRLLASLLPEHQWCVDHVDISNDVMEIRGWAIPPNGNHAAATFTVNGLPFRDITYPLDRKDVGRLFWY